MRVICAGIVLFNPSLKRLLENINSIYNQVEHLFVIDNGSKNILKIREIVSKYRRCSLIENRENLGIAKALNQMCSIAYKNGYEWILTLDQDTVSPNNIIKEFKKYLSQKNIGIICPAVKYEGLNYFNKWIAYNKRRQVSKINACMTSASLTRLSAWKEVNGFRNDYFIDYVDNEFCMKVRIKGYSIIRVYNVVISHRLGEIRILRLLWKRIPVSCHSPKRYYYMVRNNRVFITEYSKYLSVTKELLKLWYIITLGLIISNNKVETIRYIIYGYVDGLKRKLGRI